MEKLWLIRLADEIIDASKVEVELLRRKKTFTKWLKLTRLLLTLSGNKLKIYKIKGV